MLDAENDENNTFRLRAFAARLVSDSAAIEVGTPSVLPLQRQDTMGSDMQL
jgi:hypothetical protein